MKFYRCKCGAREAYGSMSPYPCSGCEKCGTTLEQHPDDHRIPKPHDWQTELVETDEGKKPRTRCSWCGVKKPSGAAPSEVDG